MELKYNNTQTLTSVLLDLTTTYLLMKYAFVEIKNNNLLYVFEWYVQ